MKLIDSAAERMTAATDAILSLAAAAAVFYLQGLPPAAAARNLPWSGAFALIAAAAALGAGYHGLVLAEKRRRTLWLALTLALGIAISLFLAGVIHDAFGPDAGRQAGVWLPILGCGVFLISRLFPGLFLVFIVYESIALVLALGTYVWLWSVYGLAGAGWMASGALVSLLAAAIQAHRRLRFSLFWEFDHNAVFHLVQVIGISLFCIGLNPSLEPIVSK
jgi:hypothetical protein